MTLRRRSVLSLLGLGTAGMVTALVNWLFKPFTTTALAWLFIRGVFSA